MIVNENGWDNHKAPKEEASKTKSKKDAPAKEVVTEDAEQK